MAESQNGSVWKGTGAAIVFAGWIAMFLFGPAVPHLVDQFRSGEDFRALSEGPVYFSGRAAYALELQNNGRIPERDVEIWVPLPAGVEVALEPSPLEFGPARPLRMREERDHRVFAIGELLPGERYTVSVAASWQPQPGRERSYRDIPWVMAKVVSAERTASHADWRSRAYRGEQRVRWHEATLNLLATALVLLLFAVSRQHL